MPCFAMLSSCSMLISCSEHCYLMLFCHVQFFTKSVNLLSFALLPCLFEPALCDLAVAQCSSFVKHLEWIIAVCFVSMLEFSSLVSCCILDGFVLLIADLCHYCFACHLQTVHPIPVIFISISTEIISSFQWHAWFAKLLPCSSFSSEARICIAYHILHIIHVLHHVACAFSVIDCGSVCLCSCCG